MVRRDHRFEVASVNDLLSHPDRGRRAGEARDELAFTQTIRGSGRASVIQVVAQVVRHAEKSDLSRREEVFVEYMLIVITDLCRGRTLIHPRVLTGLIDRVASERARVHAVVRRGLMQAHERIRVVPVTSRAMAPVHHHHLGVGIRDKCIGERHPRGAGADHEIVGLDHRQPPVLDAL